MNEELKADCFSPPDVSQGPLSCLPVREEAPCPPPRTDRDSNPHASAGIGKGSWVDKRERRGNWAGNVAYTELVVPPCQIVGNCFNRAVRHERFVGANLHHAFEASEVGSASRECGRGV